jgi:hypothetical protein
MSAPCPDTLIIRIFAEGELVDPSGRIAQHIAACAACQGLVELARREETILRTQLRLDTPAELHDAILQGTLRALDATPDSRRQASSRRMRVAGRATRAGSSSSGSRASGSRSITGPAVALLVSVGLLGATVLVYRNAQTQEPSAPAPTPAADLPAKPVAQEPARAQESPITSAGKSANDSAPSVAPEISPPRSDTAPARDPEPDDPGSIAKTLPADPRAEDPKAPDSEPRHDPAPTRPANGDAERSGGELALAVVRSGKLTVSGKALALGDAFPEGETVEVGSFAAEVESADSAKLVVASGSKLSVKKGEAGEPVFFLTSGKLLARSSGAKPYAVASADARTIPTGAVFLVAVEPGRTRVSLLEGRARVDAGGAWLDMRAGFEADLMKGKNPEMAHPFAAAHAVAWLPESARPKALPALPRIIRVFGFEDGEGFTRGDIVLGGAHGSKHALKGVSSEEGTLVELTDDRIATLALDPGLWVELVCKLDKPGFVTVELGGGHRKPERGPPRFNPGDRDAVELRTRVEAGRWTTIAAPLRDFVDMPDMKRFPGQGPGPGWRRPAKDAKLPDHVARFAVVAQGKGEPVELLVDDLRFYRED